MEPMIWSIEDVTDHIGRCRFGFNRLSALGAKSLFLGSGLSNPGHNAL